MKKLLVILSLLVFQTAHADCFILQDLATNSIIFQEGQCLKPVSPCSTFKIPLAMIGFDSQILQTPNKPIWQYDANFEQTSDFCLDSWKQAHDPSLWLKHSCVWYSQKLTTQLGMEKLQAYIDEFHYGNRDLSGNPGKQDGLTQAWLSSSLKISPSEQILFLSKFWK